MSWGSAQHVGQGNRKYLTLQVERDESFTRMGSPAAGAAQLSTPTSIVPWEVANRGNWDITAGQASRKTWQLLRGD